MFQNAFQNSPCFELFDPKDALNKANKEKEKFYLTLYKVNTTHVQKLFDKQMKNYIFELEGHTTRIQFPKDGELGLIMQYLVVQIYVPQTQQWTLEFTLTDTTKTKRHVYLTQSCKAIEKKPFHIKYPYEVPKNTWLSLQIDMYSFMQGWKGQSFRSLDLVVMQAPCKLRRVFMLRQPDHDGSITPKQVQYPIGMEYQNHIVQYNEGLDASVDSGQMKVTSKKDTGFSKQSQQQMQKAQKTTQEKITRTNIVYDDHPTPKKKQIQQQFQLNSAKLSEDMIQESNECDISTKQISRYSSKISKTDSVRKSSQNKQPPKLQQQASIKVSRTSKSVPRKQQLPQPKSQQNSQEQDDYYLKTQKFSTINDPQVIKQAMLKKEDEIEEFIEVIDTHTNRLQEPAEESQKKIITANNFNKRSISELRNDSRIQENIQLEDSLEMPVKQSVVVGQNGFYAQQMKKYTDLQRPFTPEYAGQFNFNSHNHNIKSQDQSTDEQQF